MPTGIYGKPSGRLYVLVHPTSSVALPHPPCAMPHTPGFSLSRMSYLNRRAVRLDVMKPKLRYLTTLGNSCSFAASVISLDCAGQRVCRCRCRYCCDTCDPPFRCPKSNAFRQYTFDLMQIFCPRLNCKYETKIGITHFEAPFEPYGLCVTSRLLVRFPLMRHILPGPRRHGFLRWHLT